MNERLVPILWIVLSSLLGVAGQVIAKIGLSRLALGATPRIADGLRMLGSPLIWAGGLLLLAGTVLWFYALSKIEFSIAMPLSCLLMLVFSAAAAILCFGEAIPVARAAGFALALLSVWLISR